MLRRGGIVLQNAAAGKFSAIGTTLSGTGTGTEPEQVLEQEQRNRNKHWNAALELEQILAPQTHGTGIRNWNKHLPGGEHE